MSRRSSIKRLPLQIRQELDRLLDDGRFTLDEICAHMQGLGADVSRSAVGRYSQQFEEVAARLRESRELASRFVQELGELPDNDLGRLLPEMLHRVIFDVIAKAGTGEGMDAKDLMMLARALKDATGSAKVSAELEMKIREQAKKEAQEEMKSKLDAAEGEGGLDPALADEARRILGFA